MEHSYYLNYLIAMLKKSKIREFGPAKLKKLKI